MVKPSLCNRHFYSVANYFDKRIAFRYEINGDSCLVCSKTIDVEMAKWFVQREKKSTEQLTSQLRRESL